MGPEMRGYSTLQDFSLEGEFGDGAEVVQIVSVETMLEDKEKKMRLVKSWWKYAYSKCLVVFSLIFDVLTRGSVSHFCTNTFNIQVYFIHALLYIRQMLDSHFSSISQNVLCTNKNDLCFLP